MSKASERYAEGAVAMYAPVEWFDDPHKGRALGSPRCCEAIRCVAITLEAIGRFDRATGAAVTRAVVDGMYGIWR